MVAHPSPEPLPRQSGSACECGCHKPTSGVVPSEHYLAEARRLVETNVRLGYTDLLIEQFASAMNNEALEIGRAGWLHEFALVSLRMLRDAGKLKARTDDERALLAWIEQQPRFQGSAPNRRLAWVDVPPDSREAYAERVAANAQTAFEFGAVADVA